MSAVGYVLAAVASTIGVAILLAAGFVVAKSGIAKGWKESAEGWEARCRELSATVAEKDAKLVESAETYHREITELRGELAEARERIAVLEAQRDLTPIQEEVHDMRTLSEERWATLSERLESIAQATGAAES